MNLQYVMTLIDVSSFHMNYAALQIWRGIEYSSEIVFLFLNEIHVVTHHYNRLVETVIIRSHNICFMEKCGKYP